MIATDRFVFLHLHKSGGSFVIDCIRQFWPAAREIGYHLPGSLIPAELAALPVLGLVRNPWSYYVSWYSFQRQRPQPNALFRILSDDGRLDFRGTVHRMLDLGNDDTLLAQVVTSLPAQYGGRGLNLPGFALASIQGHSTGFYSFLYDYMYGAVQAPLQVGRMEQLRQELPVMFSVAGQPVSDALRDWVQSTPARNATPHEAYGSYYDEELRERVARQDAAVIERHGYRFEA